MDIVDPATRSRMMAGIRTKNTKPEIDVRKYLHSKGLRYRLHAVDLPGKPDLIFPQYKVAVFVHGCFWHRHKGCPFTYTPATNKKFWQEKFSGNTARDARKAAALSSKGWRVLTVWECEANQKPVLDRLIRTIKRGGH